MVVQRGLSENSARAALRQASCAGSVSPHPGPTHPVSSSTASASVADSSGGSGSPPKRVRWSRKRSRSPGVGRLAGSTSPPTSTAEPVAQPQDSRGTNQVGTRCRPGATGLPATISRRRSAASEPVALKLWRTLESVGRTDEAASTSSNPTMAWSSGRERPASASAFMTPRALKSVAAITAVDGRPAASIALAAVSPLPSRLSLVSKIRLSSLAIPWSVSASR